VLEDHLAIIGVRHLAKAVGDGADLDAAVLGIRFRREGSQGHSRQRQLANITPSVEHLETFLLDGSVEPDKVRNLPFILTDGVPDGVRGQGFQVSICADAWQL
jgi:hypothetical protein